MAQGSRSTPFVLVAETAEDYARWMAALKEAIASADTAAASDTRPRP